MALTNTATPLTPTPWPSTLECDHLSLSPISNPLHHEPTSFTLSQHRRTQLRYSQGEYHASVRPSILEIPPPMSNPLHHEPKAFTFSQHPDAVNISQCHGQTHHPYLSSPARARAPRTTGRPGAPTPIALCRPPNISGGPWRVSHGLRDTAPAWQFLRSTSGQDMVDLAAETAVI